MTHKDDVIEKCEGGYNLIFSNPEFNEGDDDVVFEASVGQCGELLDDDKGYDPYNHTPAWMHYLPQGTVSISRLTFTAPPDDCEDGVECPM